MQKIKSAQFKEHWPYLIFTLLILGSFFFHEAWRDEIQALLIAKAPLGIKEFFTKTLHYEGHPFLWFYVLKIFSPVGISTFGLQLANSVFILGATALIWWKMPLEKSLKIFLLFNYYFIYEFGVIARSYTLGIFLVIFYVSYSDSETNLWRRLAFIALLLCPQVSIYSLVIASALFFSHFLQEITERTRTTLFQAILFSISVLLAILQMIPAPDESAVPAVAFEFNLGKFNVFSKLFGEAFFYIPNLPAFPNIWNTSLDLSPIFLYMRALFSLFLLGFFTYSIYKKRPSLALGLALGVIVLLSFTYFKFMGSLRHMSHILLLMLAFYWLAQKKKHTVLHSSTVNISMTIFAISICSGALNYFSDLMLPFSDAKNAAKVISPTDKLIMGVPDYALSTISGFSEGREIFFLDSMRSGTYVIWNQKKELVEKDLKKGILYAFEKYGVEEALFISSNPQINTHFRRAARNDLIYESLGCIVPDECYQVYKIRKKHVLASP